MKISAGLILVLALLGFCNCATWAVLVAGSNGFSNYRHQADICHAYQTLIKGGLPASNIIVFSYDDIAHNIQNPVKGKIFNKPNGNDVYAGCVIDYKGKDVTPQNFLNVLKQNSAAMSKIGTGRVLKSTNADKVFINFADHGAPGLIAFPSSYLYATDLTPVLNGMWTAKQYQECTFYLEACESGSMFNTFPTNQKLYAVTAANPDESSWAAYCPPDDLAGGKHIGSCLGDLFSVNWMENTDATNTTQETLQQQYQIVTQLTNLSHVMQYGDLSFTSESVNNFVGNQKATVAQEERKASTFVSSRDNLLAYLINRHNKLNNKRTQAALNREINSRKMYDRIFRVVSNMPGKTLKKAETTDFECYKTAISTLEKGCGRTSDYGLKYFRNLYDICAEGSINKRRLFVMLKNECRKHNKQQKRIKA